MSVHKLTKKETIKLIINHTTLDHRLVSNIIEILEMLGIIKFQSESQTPDIPIDFQFNWHDRKNINNIFAELKKQGFKVVKE